jgi:Spy/CpxP family protein refolding chaperone
VLGLLAGEAVAQRHGGAGLRRWAHFSGCPLTQPADQDRPLAQMIHEHFAKLLDLKDGLKLTDEQRDAIHKILRDHRDELRPQIAAVMGQHRVLHDAVLADEPDEKTIRDAASGLGQKIGDAAVVASQVAKEVKTVLTPEQLQALRDFGADRQDAVDAFLEHMTGD